MKLSWFNTSMAHNQYQAYKRHEQYDAAIISQILPDHNEHGAFEGHGKENVTSKVSDPPFTNLVQRSDNNKKIHAHWMTFW